MRFHHGFNMFPDLVYTDSLSSPHKDNKEKTRKFVDDFNRCVKGEYELLPNQHYINAKTHLLLKHTCGEVISMTPTNLLNIKEGVVKTNCKKCALRLRDDIQRFSMEDHVEALREKGFPVEEFVFLGNYKDTHTKIEVKHLVCNNTFMIRPREQVQGNLCKFCTNNQRSRMEKALYDEICNWLPNLDIEQNAKLLKDRRSEVDIYIPDFKLAIEFNGSWWHREEVNNGRDYEKLLELSENTIRLVTVREHEWKFHKEKVLSRLKSILGLTETIIYGRKTYVQEISSSAKSTFLDENHLQGKDKSYLNLGLYTKDTNELVAVMTFSKPRKSMNGSDIELSRFCNKLNTTVIGGFSKLFKYACSIIGPGNRIRTYANLSYSIGEVYEKNGFRFSHISKPSYWYINYNTGKAYHRFNFRKSIIPELVAKGKLKFYDDSMSEKEIMWKNKYFTILDCGNAVYIYDI